MEHIALFTKLMNRTLAKRSQLRRFLSDNPMSYKAAIEAAESYVAAMGADGESWLRLKPYDRTPGHPEFFRLLYDVMNLLKVMRVPPGGRVLEVGSGPGWVTEILILLGHPVESLEPSTDMVRIARERIAGTRQHYHLDPGPEVVFHAAAMEKVTLADETFDAVIFFDSLHHCVDEQAVMDKSFRCLKPGGKIGVVEGAWHPRFTALESALLDEMRQFGTLENPFSQEYLDALLTDVGFTEIERFVPVNGFFRQAQLDLKIRDVSPCPMDGSNNLIAIKPSGNSHPSCADVSYRTDAVISLTKGHVDAAIRRADIEFVIENRGETLFEDDPNRTGYVTLSLRRGKPGAADFAECTLRYPLPEKLVPGQKIALSRSFMLPQGLPAEGWELDLICEGVYWFSDRGIASCPVPVG